MDTVKDEIHESNQSGSCLTVDKNLYIQELEAENRRLKQEIESLKAENATEHEERYRAIFDNSIDGIILSFPDGTILSANPAACRMFGRSEEEMCAVGRKGIVDLGDPRVMQAVKKREKTGVFFSEMTLIRKNGTKFPGEVASRTFKDRQGRNLSSMIVRDISVRKQAEATLRWSEEKFSKAFEHNQAMMTISRLKDNMLISLNKSFTDIMGFQPEELENQCVLNLNHWANLKERQDMLQRILEQGYIKNYEVGIRKKSREMGWALMSANTFDIEGEQYLISSAIDITERKKNEEALRLSEESFNKAFNSYPLSMAIVSVNDGSIRKFNEVFGINIGCRADLKQPRVTDIQLWADLSERAQFMERVRTEHMVKNFEASIRSQSGEILTVLLSGVAIDWQGEECFLVITNDITELRRYQNEMGRLDRMKLIGEMSASIAHEIRNPMATVSGFLQLFRNQERYAEDRENMNLMIEEMNRANEIITEFLALAQNKAVNIKQQNLNCKINELFPLLQADAMKNDINIKLELVEVPDLMIDKGEIRQLILNLVRNGMEAMSAGGCLTIKTVMESDAVTLAIQDQGEGIRPEVLEKIGTPFFTTKENGTGLGLAVCYSIAHRHHARIELETGSAGTVFKVIFPIHSEGATATVIH